MIENNIICVTNDGLNQLMAVLQCSGRCLLPAAENDAHSFAQARREWVQAGLVMEDFDGKMHPIPLFSRMHYNLVNSGAVMHFIGEKHEVYYVRGPVDLLCMQRLETAGWQLRLCPMQEIQWWLRKKLPLMQKGTLATQSICAEQPLSTDVAQLCALEKEEYTTAIREHQHMFFRKEEDQHAGNSSGDD